MGGSGKAVVRPLFDGLAGLRQDGHAFLLQPGDPFVVDTVFFQRPDPRPEQGPHVSGHPVVRAVNVGPIIYQISLSLGMRVVGIEKQQFPAQHRVRKR